jgi:hypothetical protein
MWTNKTKAENKDCSAIMAVQVWPIKYQIKFIDLQGDEQINL